MAIIPTKYMNAVFSIGFHQYDGSLSWTGTGFMVMRPIKHDSEKQSYCLEPKAIGRSVQRFIW